MKLFRKKEIDPFFKLFEIPCDYDGYDLVFEQGKTSPDIYYSINEIITNGKYEIKTDKIKKELVDKLYGNTLKTSISRLEQYKSCPFSYYLKYGLNLQERQEFKVQAIDTGTFMHDVIDSFFDKMQERGISVKGISDEEEEDIVDEIIEEKLGLKKNYIFTGIPKYKVLASRLKKVIKK